MRFEGKEITHLFDRGEQAIRRGDSEIAEAWSDQGSWQGNFESWVQGPFTVRPIAHAIWDPHFGQPVWKPLLKEVLSGPMNIAYYGVYRWCGLVTPTTKWKPKRLSGSKCESAPQPSFVGTLEYGRGAYPILVCTLVPISSLQRGREQLGSFIRLITLRSRVQILSP
ncbi:hypothetical protein IFM89_019712 [Coptis chinensis]|uniref:Uncharacterized protein n=1 Tax=Coptis chinensis TaxID=261450 RepID=A0A835H0A0_9MAGN|nr:hypothetical protein IFM89_019712 [Coptis chinensis]